MCGIVAIASHKPGAARFILEGLQRLEYRGYDSAGIVVQGVNGLRWEKLPGKLARLAAAVRQNPATDGTTGIGHTRWATHGPPTRENAHPHFSCDGRIAVIHNGIIENFAPIKERLIREGHVFRSDTDTEVVAHVLETHRGVPPLEAMRRAVRTFEGAFALAAVFADHPDTLIAARRMSPLVLGLGKDWNGLASDIPALLPHTRQVILLDDGEVARLTPETVEITTFAGEPVRRAARKVTWSVAGAEKGDYPHFMLKEIHEQPTGLRRTLAGRIDLAAGRVILKGTRFPRSPGRNGHRVCFVACGTAWHAALYGKYIFEDFAGIPAEAWLASEFRYARPAVDKKTLLIAVTQSGETIDTLAAVQDGRARGAFVLTICNVPESSIPRASDGVLLTHAGPEIGVAATKTYTAQLAAIALVGIALGRRTRRLSADRARTLLKALQAIPASVERVLAREEPILACARKFAEVRDLLYIGRHFNFPTALEGALKLKEISYIHAEGYAAGEMKHGPLALVDERYPTVAIAPRDPLHAKMMSNIQEIRARKGPVVVVATEGDREVAPLADNIFEIPSTEPPFTPILAVVPLQLLAYHLAIQRGCDVDQPRNLAKSVTVE